MTSTILEDDAVILVGAREATVDDVITTPGVDGGEGNFAIGEVVINLLEAEGIDHRFLGEEEGDSNLHGEITPCQGTSVIGGTPLFADEDGCVICHSAGDLGTKYLLMIGDQTEKISHLRLENLYTLIHRCWRVVRACSNGRGTWTRSPHILTLVVIHFPLAERILRPLL